VGEWYGTTATYLSTSYSRELVESSTGYNRSYGRAERMIDSKRLRVESSERTVDEHSTD
jgi:hypothetical protein